MLLTGTPFGKQLLDLWTQYYVTDRGDTFYSNYRKFVLQYFEDKGYFGEEWHVTDVGRQVIELLMFRRAMRYSEKEVKGLPPKIYRTLNFELTSQQSLDYNKALKRVEDFKDIVNRTMIFRQICSGVIVSKNYKYKENPKLEVLKDFLDSIVYKSKVVIFHEFLLENEIITYMLKRHFKKIRFAQLNSRVKDKWAEIKAFQNDDDVRVMIAHPQSGGASIDLNIAHYCIFFSNNHDPISRQQCEKRIHRGKIKNRRFFYDLVAKGTIEVGMYKALRENENFFKSIMDKDMLQRALLGGE
jgi:SNF2 family DNA or RNA helicase